MTMIDLGPGYGVQNGRSVFSIKLSKSSVVNEPCWMSHVSIPSFVYAGRIDQRSLRLNSTYS
jgi:hypothetical protein